ncbi:kinesin-like protein [Basidiobolus ranarum]|uniref:Kinesin-like protein n=1 Tax=Basidiobolus ranarum TaxID=34480 RepID=A0ABR2VZQ8_9FUNG
MQHQVGPGKAGFDPFGGPYTSAYEQGSFNFRRPAERQENWQDGFRPEYRGMDQGNNWNNEHLPHPGNNRNIHPNHQQQPQMHSGELGMSGLDPDAIRVMMERQRYIQILQQRQQMLMHQFQQPYSPPAQQPQSPGFQNELLTKLLPHINAGQPNDPMLQTRGMNMNAQLPGWSGPNPNDAEPTSPYRQMENPQFRQNWPHDNAGASVDPRNPALQNPNHFGNDVNAPGPEFQNENVTNQQQENQMVNTLEMKDVEPAPQSFPTTNTGKDKSQELENESAETIPEPVKEETKEMAHSLAHQEETSQHLEGSISHDETEQMDTYNASNSAPWAKANSSPDMEADSASDRLSLREIQEIEAKMAEAHKMERQAQLHSEFAMLQHQEKSDHEASAALTAAMSGWHNTNAPKKSILEIQKEEEEATKRKARLEMQSKLASIAGSAGKRYADTVAAGSKTSEGWVTVVGSKNQTDKVTNIPVTANKPEPTSTVKATPQAQLKPTASDFPLPSMASTITRKKSYQESKPSEEFLKWCRASLKDLNGINVDDFVQMLLTFPLNPPPATIEIISESVYASSTTLDGRRFAHEFIKMRKIDAGLIPGRIGETVKASEEPEEATISNQGFKVVTKKKGRKH